MRQTEAPADAVQDHGTDKRTQPAVIEITRRSSAVVRRPRSRFARSEVVNTARSQGKVLRPLMPWINSRGGLPYTQAKET